MPLVMKKQLTFQVDVMLSPIPSTLKLMKDGKCKVQICVDANLNPVSSEQLEGLTQSDLDHLLADDQLVLVLSPTLLDPKKPPAVGGFDG